MDFKLPLLAAALVLLTQPANAELFVTGSTFTVTGTNAPDTFSSTATLTSGTTSSLDNGALSLLVTLVPTSGSAEWAVFQYSTVSGATIGNANLNWALNEVGLQLAQPAILQEGFVLFTQTGTALTPTSGIFPGFSVAANPVPGGTGEGVLGTGTTNLPAGPLQSLGSFLGPFGQLSGSGIDPASVNGYEEALLFAPQVAAVPGPTVGAGLPGLIFAGAGLLGLLHRRRNAAAA
jgi:hypothetical protein